MTPIVIGGLAGLVAVALDRALNRENDNKTSAVIVFIVTVLAMFVIYLMGGEK